MDSRLRVLVFSIVFPPDGVSTSQLLGEIVEDLSDNGMHVEVITTRPHYNVDAEAQARQPISWKWHKLYGTSHLGSTKVTHLNMPGKASGRVGRLLQWAWFHLGSFGLGARRDADVALTVSPPPTVALVSAMLRKIGGPPIVFCLWEMYPDILIALGKIKPTSNFLGPLKALERFTYRASDHVTVLHRGMLDAVVTTSPQTAEKVTIVPTFADTSFLKPSDRNTDMRRELGLEDSFIVGYAGNIGAAQDLHVAIEAATLLQDDASITFVICGDGHDRPRIEAAAASAGLTNVVFTGHLPYAMVPEIYATFDVSLVALSEGLSAEALPSKIYRTMACGRPIVAICEPASSLAQFVSEHDAGYRVPPNDSNELAGLIRQLAASPIEAAAVGIHASQVAQTQFSRAAVTARLATLLREVAGRQGRS